MHGKFFWYDIMTTDTKASEKFYADVVGWGARDSGVPGQQYTLLTVNGTPVAGLMPIPEDARKVGVPPSWMGYIAVDDVDRPLRGSSRKAGRSIARLRMCRALSVSASLPILRARVSSLPRGLVITRNRNSPSARWGRLAGASFTPWNGKLPLSLMRKCSAGPRPRQ